MKRLVLWLSCTIVILLMIGEINGMNRGSFNYEDQMQPGNLLGSELDKEEENERWDKESGVYSNFEYGFAWQLPREITWIKIGGTERHTVFKATIPSEGIVVLVNVKQVAVNGAIDIWNYAEQMKAYFRAKEGKQAINGEYFQYTVNSEKCILCGKHALKLNYISWQEDDRHDEPVVYRSFDYIYVYDGYIYILAVKMLEEMYEDIKEADLDFLPEDMVDEIYSGYTIVHKN